MRKVERRRASQEPDPKHWSLADQTTKHLKPRTPRKGILGTTRVAANVQRRPEARARWAESHKGKAGGTTALQFVRHRLLDDEGGEFLGGIIERGIGSF